MPHTLLLNNQIRQLQLASVEYRLTDPTAVEKRGVRK